MANRFKQIYILTKEDENQTLTDLKQFFIDHYKKETTIVSIVEGELAFQENSIYFYILMINQ